MNLIFSDVRSIGACSIHLLGIEIPQSDIYIEKMVELITDTSWIMSLDTISQRSYRASSVRTITQLSHIFSNAVEPICGEVGEYVVSLSSQDALQAHHEHKTVPLAELWKTRVKGNDGFDFHTVTSCGRLNFGEAKFNKTQHAYTKAATQVLDFIRDDKDNADLVHLRNIVKEQLLEEKIAKGEFHYSISFSVNSEDLKLILENSLKSIEVMKLISQSKVLFVIGVKIAST